MDWRDRLHVRSGLEAMARVTGAQCNKDEELSPNMFLLSDEMLRQGNWESAVRQRGQGGRWPAL